MPGAPLHGSRSNATLSGLRQAIDDLLESWGRVIRKAHMPTREGVVAFFANQVLANAVAWTAGVTTVALVKHFFEVKGLRNLWGLTASSRRTLVSRADYEMIMTLTSYTAGLIMLILMRHLVLRLITEFRSLRLEREDHGAFDSAQAAPEGCDRPNARQLPSEGRVPPEDLELVAEHEWDD